MGSKPKIVIATIKSWNIQNANTFKDQTLDKYDVIVIEKKEDLSVSALNKILPTFIFFPHWSWIIPKEIYSAFNCIVFHMTDLPFGRGGSPLQNLIQRKIYKTVSSAIQVGPDIDSGPVYLKKPFDISTGSAQEILRSFSELIFFEMIPEIISSSKSPVPQIGEPLHFTRRGPKDSEFDFLKIEDTTTLYDFIRMLDGEGYPAATCKIGNWEISLTNGELNESQTSVKGHFVAHLKK